MKAFLFLLITFFLGNCLTAQEPKTYIDKKYSTLKDPANTFVAGSSMGGLISMYAICEYPDVYGGAACILTH